MKLKNLILSALVVATRLQLTFATPLGTAFTYQGKLNDGGQPATGLYDFSFTLHADTIHPIAIGTAAQLTAVPVTNGLFTVQLNSAGEFGVDAFNGGARWLQIRVRTNDDANISSFITLGPRQPLSATPHALFALDSLSASTVADGAITSAKLAPGAVSSANVAAGAIGSAQLANGAVDSSKIADGSITMVDIAAGAITPGLLAKPYQSASLCSTRFSVGFGPAEFTNVFSPAFTATPVVTASLESAASDFAGAVQAWVNTRSPTGFGITLQRAVGPTIALDYAYNAGFGETASESGWSIAGVNGRPASAYCYFSTGLAGSDSSLVYRASLNSASSVWSRQIVVTNVSVGSSCVGVANGHPAIAFNDGLAVRVQFVRALDINGNAWATPVTVDATVAGGELSSAVVNGNPAISYYDSTLGVLKFVRAADANGSVWNAPQILDAGGNAGRFTTLLIVNGNPAISYYDVTGKSLRYMRATDASGAAAWSAPVIVESAGDVGKFASLAVVNGHPALAYLQSDLGQIKYSRALDINGAAWSAGQVIVTNALASAISLVNVGARPAVAFQNGANSSYLAARDADGSVWAAPLAVNTGSANTLMAVVNGAPFLLDTHYDIPTQKTALNVTTTLGGNFTLNWMALQP